MQHSYATRTELVRDGCQQMLDQARAQYDARTAALPPLERLRALLHWAVPTTTGWAVGTVVWNAYQSKSVDDTEIAALVTQAHADSVARAAACIEEARRDGALADGEDASAVGLRLLSTSEGYATRVVIGSLAADDALSALDRELDALRPGGVTR